MNDMQIHTFGGLKKKALAKGCLLKYNQPIKAKFSPCLHCGISMDADGSEESLRHHQTCLLQETCTVAT